MTKEQLIERKAKCERNSLCFISLREFPTEQMQEVVYNESMKVLINKKYLTTKTEE